MSLTNPDTRWWRTNTTRRTIAYLCIVLGILGAFVGSWRVLGLEAALENPTPDAVGLIGIFASIPLIVGGGLLYGFGVDDASQSRLVLWSLPLYFIATGSGLLLGSTQSSSPVGTLRVMSTVFLVGGIVAIVVIEIVRRRSRAAAQVRARVDQRGVTTRGVVTRAMSYTLNYQPVTRVTVRFADQNGQTRWTKQRLHGNVAEGTQVTVRYSPEDLGRKGAVLVAALGARGRS